MKGVNGEVLEVSSLRQDPMARGIGLNSKILAVRRTIKGCSVHDNYVIALHDFSAGQYFQSDYNKRIYF